MEDWSFSNPITFDIQERIMLWGKIWEYKAHVEESVKKQENMTYFKNGKLMIFQDNNKTLNSAVFGSHYNVKILALIVSYDNEQEVIDASGVIYNRNICLLLIQKHIKKSKRRLRNMKVKEIIRKKEKYTKGKLMKIETKSEIRHQRKS